MDKEIFEIRKVFKDLVNSSRKELLELIASSYQLRDMEQIRFTGEKAGLKKKRPLSILVCY